MKNLNKMKIAGDMQFEIGQDKVSHFADLSVKDDSTLHKKLDDMKHSTFDLSKFTVVGSPTITDDGVASGFSDNDYAETKSILLGSGNWKIRANHTTCNTVGSKGFIVGTSFGGIYYYNSRIFFGVRDAESVFLVNSSFKPNINTNYLLELEYKNNVYTGKYSVDNGSTWVTVVDVTSSKLARNITTEQALTIGNVSLTGSIDLKQFSITVDGKEVFSGNKTGIDTIKPDNYEVVGSPTISDDGVASGISGSNYLTFPLNINPQNTLKIHIEGVHGDTQTSAGTLFYISDGTTSLTLYRNRSSKMSGEVGSTPKTYMSDSAITTNGARYKYVVSFDIVTNKYSYQYYENDVLITQKDNILISVLANMNWSNITIGNIGRQYSPLNGSIDLNSFKIYVDGNLVYQPRLKIPYTLSKTGSKIVDVAYRDRVIDLYEQEGYTHYYTIGENDFTLATCKGSDVVAQGEADGIAYTKTADLTLTQRGNCTSGSVVNLLPYKDENSYHVSAPYTAKTSNSFTPSADGDFIAIGKCYL